MSSVHFTSTGYGTSPRVSSVCMFVRSNSEPWVGIKAKKSQKTTPSPCCFQKDSTHLELTSSHQCYQLGPPITTLPGTSLAYLPLTTPTPLLHPPPTSPPWERTHETYIWLNHICARAPPPSTCVCDSGRRLSPFCCPGTTPGRSPRRCLPNTRDRCVCFPRLALTVSNPCAIVLVRPW